jgi:hypothetical protein
VTRVEKRVAQMDMQRVVTMVEQMDKRSVEKKAALMGVTMVGRWVSLLVVAKVAP